VNSTSALAITQGGSPISLSSGPDDDFHVLSESLQKSNEPIGRKAIQLAPHQSGHFGLVDSKSVGRLSLFAAKSSQMRPPNLALA